MPPSNTGRIMVWQCPSVCPSERPACGCNLLVLQFPLIVFKCGIPDWNHMKIMKMLRQILQELLPFECQKGYNVENAIYCLFQFGIEFLWRLSTLRIIVVMVHCIHFLVYIDGSISYTHNPLSDAIVCRFEWTSV